MLHVVESTTTEDFSLDSPGAEGRQGGCRRTAGTQGRDVVEHDEEAILLATAPIVPMTDHVPRLVISGQSLAPPEEGLDKVVMMMLNDVRSIFPRGDLHHARRDELLPSYGAVTSEK